MSRVAHFEIQAADLERGPALYAAAFGSTINGGLQQRPGAAPVR